MKSETRSSQTEAKSTDRSDKESVVRELAEHELEKFGAGNLVEFVRDVVGDEPIRDQPRAIRLFVIVCLGAPFLALVWFEWLFRQLIPLWISLPLTAIGLVVSLWKYLGRSKESDVAAPMRRPSPPTAVASSVRDESAGAQDARVLARFLVSQVKLYNRELVDRGLREGSLYKLLKKEIDGARAMYDSNVPASVRSAHDYFQEEVVRILARGNPDLL